MHTYPGEPVVVEGSSRGMSEGLHNGAEGQSDPIYFCSWSSSLRQGCTYEVCAMLFEDALWLGMVTVALCDMSSQAEAVPSKLTWRSNHLSLNLYLQRAMAILITLTLPS